MRLCICKEKETKEKEMGGDWHIKNHIYWVKEINKKENSYK